MAGQNYGGAIADIGSAANDLLQGQATEEADTLKAQGDIAEGQEYALADQEATVETAVKEAQSQRSVYMAESGTTQEVAGAGFTSGGSAGDIMRSNAQQGAMSSAMIQQQGMVTEQTDVIQEDAANNAAQSEMKMADQARSNSYITAGFAALSAIGSMIPVS